MVIAGEMGLPFKRRLGWVSLGMKFESPSTSRQGLEGEGEKELNLSALKQQKRKGELLRQVWEKGDGG